MRQDPGLDLGALAACLAREDGLSIASLRFLLVGHDMSAAAYAAASSDGRRFFVKVRLGPVDEAALQVPRALIDRGVPHILAPLRSRSGALRRALDDATVVLYPFIEGASAMVAGLTDDQWRTFGVTLRAVHDSGLDATVDDRLRRETFALPSAALVRKLLVHVAETDFAGPTAAHLAAFLREHAGRIRVLLERAEAIGRSLQAKAFDHVLCHTDIHAANLLVGADGELHLIDWDAPMIAPRERDLLFIIGSRIARPVEPWQEARFFEGYGPVAIDADALIYYRYERIVEDLGEFGKSVFLDPALSEETRAGEAELAMSFFVPGGDLDRAETVILPGVNA